MEKREIIKYASLNSLGTFLYIVLIVLFISNVDGSRIEASNSILLPIFMLMLFVFSAGLTSSLVIGRPILWYLEGKKSEAVRLFIFTISIFLMIMILAFLFLIFST